jgi:uncharacterized membrane protein
MLYRATSGGVIGGCGVALIVCGVVLIVLVVVLVLLVLIHFYSGLDREKTKTVSYNDNHSSNFSPTHRHLSRALSTIPSDPDHDH